MSQRVAALEQEIERLTDGAELDNVSLSLNTCHLIYKCSNLKHSSLCAFLLPPALQLRREKVHLESELERAERESATYVTEVREVSLLLKKTSRGTLYSD